VTTTEIKPVALSIPDFCTAYSVSRSRTYQLIGAGAFVVKKLGAKTLIDKTSADRWFASLPGFTPANRITKMRAARGRAAA
jgi:hypothetical protein